MFENNHTESKPSSTTDKLRPSKLPGNGALPDEALASEMPKQGERNLTCLKDKYSLLRSVNDGELEPGCSLNSAAHHATCKYNWPSMLGAEHFPAYGEMVENPNLVEAMASKRRKIFEKNHTTRISRPPKAPRLFTDDDAPSQSSGRGLLLFIDDDKPQPLSATAVDEPSPSNLPGDEASPHQAVAPPDKRPNCDTPDQEEQKKTQTGETMAQFIAEMPKLLRLILSNEAGPEVGTLCSCESGQYRTVQCHDCFKYETSCEQCFVDRHQRNPFHWPRVWQPEGFYRKMDIACLLNNTYSIHVCSHGIRCRSPAPPQKVTVVDTNGIHSTRLSYCYCDGYPDYVEQLMNVRLFPATLRSPRTMMTFRVLDEFHEHHLASKKAAYDYVGALRRLTDGAFTPDVADPYLQFLLVMRIWRRLLADKHTGQAYNLSSFFPHRQPGSLVLFCFGCPEDGFNMEKGWENTPAEMKHLNQIQEMADGNYQLNAFAKNNDPNDVSLETANGIGYFPDEDVVKRYLKDTVEEQEKSTCNYLKVVNNQNQKKFKNMRISGVVNIACSHLIIRSSVNLNKGEGYTDLAWKHSLSHTRHNRDCSHHGTTDRMLSYDCMCQYCVNLVKRFTRNFPDLKHIAERVRCSIPALHIEGHKDRCKYEFHSAYIPGAGHFHGEGIETPWAELNQVGAATRQMNHGHRMGVITAHYTYWNWLKTVKMHITLADQYREAKELFEEKHEVFLRLCVSFEDRIPGWLTLEKMSPRLPNGIVKNIYEHSKSKAPSKEKVYQELLESSAKIQEIADTGDDTVLLLQEGLAIQHLQERVRGKLTLNQTETVQKDIRSRRNELTKHIEDFRILQAIVMPRVDKLVSALSSTEVEKEKLYLPSDIQASDHESLQLTMLAQMEQKVRLGELYDSMKSVQKAAKAYSVTHIKKREDERGTNAGLRSTLALKKIEVERDCCVADYNRARTALINLKFSGAHDIPPMSIADTYRRSTFNARQLGDSRRTDGSLFRLPALPAMTYADEVKEGSDEEGPIAGTLAVRRKRAVRKIKSKKEDNTTELKKEKGDGWIWTTALIVGANSSEDLAEYEEEGDRIQWFRAREEMERWRETIEQIQATFLNIIRGHHFMQKSWSKMADLRAAPAANTLYPHTAWSMGHAAYARRQAKMYEQFYINSKNTYARLWF
ncbi:hypothetical protein BT96DRAFT_1008199 [Gymnopus androsaceus JB14]|uniref:CxC2-like cysteine cluster KDZ transposase-associated domain-containing protein n=1 Tax=Gymnopus androsaceus JB14 TaxID=1447944 RepID=A0A6A4GGA1_9AGAR|nr:hypothetical protein BT96DRAFT_1008199 [Gymnopus androsaceus JB14]